MRFDDTKEEESDEPGKQTKEMLDVVVLVVCHGQVRRQVSQGSRCRDS